MKRRLRINLGFRLRVGRSSEPLPGSGLLPALLVCLKDVLVLLEGFTVPGRLTLPSHPRGRSIALVGRLIFERPRSVAATGLPRGLYFSPAVPSRLPLGPYSSRSGRTLTSGRTPGSGRLPAQAGLPAQADSSCSGRAPLLGTPPTRPQYPGANRYPSERITGGHSPPERPVSRASHTPRRRACSSRADVLAKSRCSWLPVRSL